MDGGGGGLLQALEVRRLLGRRLTAGGAGLAGEAVVSAVTSNSLEKGGGVPRRWPALLAFAYLLVRVIQYVVIR